MDAIEFSLTDYQRLSGHPVVEAREVALDVDVIEPVVTIVIVNGGPFRAFRLEAFILDHHELHHVRTKLAAPAQSGSRERGLGP